MGIYQGQVLYRIKGFYYVKSVQFQTLQCKIKGNLFKNSRYDNQIAVGDRVNFEKKDSNDVGMITSILPRDSFLSRSRIEKQAEQVLAANIDYLLITVSTKSPPFRHNLIQRMLAAARSGNIEPVIVVTKTDLIETDQLNLLISPYQKAGERVFTHSAHNKEINPDLLDLMKSHVCALSGHSGVGKSSLINFYFPGLNLKVGQVNKKSSKGAHTTTFAKMIELDTQSYIIDTPGIREYGLWKVDKENLDEYFPVFDEFRSGCFHRNCSHTHEPQCGVKKALEEGLIPDVYYQGYQSIYESL